MHHSVEWLGLIFDDMNLPVCQRYSEAHHTSLCLFWRQMNMSRCGGDIDEDGERILERVDHTQQTIEVIRSFRWACVELEFHDSMVTFGSILMSFRIEWFVNDDVGPDF